MKKTAMKLNGFDDEKAEVNDAGERITEVVGEAGAPVSPEAGRS